MDRVIAVHGLRLCVYSVTSYIKGSNVVKPDVLEIRYVGKSVLMNRRKLDCMGSVYAQLSKSIKI